MFGSVSLCLSLMEHEEELVLENVDSDTIVQSYDLCLAGRFLTDRSINFNATRNKVARLWRPGRGMCTRELSDSKYLIQFFHSVDMKRVLEGAPWAFDNHLLLLHRLVEGDVPRQIPVNHVDFWVQIYELQVGYMSLGIGKQLGDFIGTSVDYDTIKNNGARRSYMRIRVTIDGHHPLKKIRKGEGSSYMVQFKYERIGHADRFCEHLFEMHERERLGDMVKGVGKEKLRRGWWSMAAGGYRICNCHVIPAS